MVLDNVVPSFITKPYGHAIDRKGNFHVLFFTTGGSELLSDTDHIIPYYEHIRQRVPSVTLDERLEIHRMPDGINKAFKELVVGLDH